MNSSIVVFEFRIIINLFLSYFFSSDIFQHIIKFLNDYNLKWYTNFLEESTTLHSAHSAERKKSILVEFIANVLRPFKLPFK